MEEQLKPPTSIIDLPAWVKRMDDPFRPFPKGADVTSAGLTNIDRGRLASVLRSGIGWRQENWRRATVPVAAAAALLFGACGHSGGPHTLPSPGPRGSATSSPSTLPESPSSSVKPVSPELKKQQDEVLANIQEFARLSDVKLDQELNQSPIQIVGTGDVWNIEGRNEKNKNLNLTRYQGRFDFIDTTKAFLFTYGIHDFKEDQSLFTTGVLLGLVDVPVQQLDGTATIAYAGLRIPQTVPGSTAFDQVKYKRFVIRFVADMTGRGLDQIGPLLDSYAPYNLNDHHEIQIWPKKVDAKTKAQYYVLSDNSRAPVLIKKQPYRQKLDQNIGRPIDINFANTIAILSAVGAPPTVPSGFDKIFGPPPLLQATEDLFGKRIAQFNSEIVKGISNHQVLPVDVKKLPSSDNGVGTVSELPPFGFIGIMEGSVKLLM